MNRSLWRSSRTPLGTFLRNHTHLHPYVLYQLGRLQLQACALSSPALPSAPEQPPARCL